MRAPLWNAVLPMRTCFLILLVYWFLFGRYRCLKNYSINFYPIKYCRSAILFPQRTQGILSGPMEAVSVPEVSHSSCQNTIRHHISRERVWRCPCAVNMILPERKSSFFRQTFETRLVRFYSLRRDGNWYYCGNRCANHKAGTLPPEQFDQYI